ncbi:MAG: hypothetical protein PF569_05365 [Candidatus Woesearchaeota archaeon]|jgi:hypothetical protein|nr:hypothetical protein [Candidatus Woesearchaeota archaeon]
MKKIYTKVITLVLVAVFTNSTYAFSKNDDVLKLKVTDNKEKVARAEILNLDDSNEYYEDLKVIELVGKKTQTKDVLNIDWNKIKLGEAEIPISPPFSSKVKVTNDIKKGNKFSAKGSYSHLISSMEELLQMQEDSNKKYTKNTRKTVNTNSTSSSSFQSSYRPLTNLNNNKDEEEIFTSAVTEIGEEITLTDGCLPYVDYELNTIYMQQRVIRDGEEIQACHNSSISFPLQKDYDVCPDKEDASTGAKEVYFQYYYIDDRNGNNARLDVGQCQLDLFQSTGGDTQEVTTTDGCSPYIDYTLSSVYIQQRILQGSEVIQACHNSSTSFPLQKNYEICPDKIDTEYLMNKVYFQYYYVDTRDGNDIAQNIGDCQLDSTQSGSLAVTQNYENCTQFIDLSAMRIYDQYQEYYSDSDDNEILLNDCQKDLNRSFRLDEDFNKCPIKHDFEKGYSISQKEIGYTDGEGAYHKVYDCTEDTDYKYTHYSTSDSCSNVITDDEVQIFTRKYITVDGVREYISECTPAEGNVTVENEICYTNQYTHELENKQSYINRNYFYMDSYGQRVDISTCVKSGEPIPHLEEASVCEHIDDDSTKQTTMYSKTFIEVNGSREYIGECKEMLTKVPYAEIGYKWKNEFSTSSTAIAVGNSRDNIFLGSKEGYENTRTDDYGQTTIYNKYDISNYSTSGKCDGYTSPSYNGVAIDLSLSSTSAITLNNFVENRPVSDVCYWYCYYKTTYPFKECKYTPSRICRDNVYYYQRCTSHKCPLTKTVKFPIYRRGDGSQLVDESINKEVKYICGNSSVLDGTEVFYDN